MHWTSKLNPGIYGSVCGTLFKSVISEIIINFLESVKNTINAQNARRLSLEILQQIVAKAAIGKQLNMRSIGMTISLTRFALKLLPMVIVDLLNVRTVLIEISLTSGS